MPRWTEISTAECVGIAAIHRQKLIDCDDPKSKKIVYCLTVEFPIGNISFTSGSFNKFVFPIMRPYFTSNLVNSLVSVQPMGTLASATANISYFNIPEPEFRWVNLIYNSNDFFLVDNRRVIRKIYLSNKYKSIINKAIQKYIEKLNE